jgi:long-chain acyl-CoA synthetase
VEPVRGQPVRDGNELATIMYTSGTTGTPKGVMHSFATFAWSIEAALRRLPGSEHSRILSYLPLSHVAERTLVEHGLLATGMQVFFAESLDTFAADLRRARPTRFFSVPRLWVKFQQGVLAKMPPQKLDRLLRIPIVSSVVRRKILTALGLEACEIAAGGAAPMPADLLRWYRRLGLEIIEVYGMTENCGVSHCTLRGRPQPGTVGYPYEGVESRIDPDTDEVQVRSPGTMLGYYKAPEQTRDAFTADGWLRTGDKGVLDEAGGLRISGRVKDIFKTSKGKYVTPAPIEDRLVMHPAVEACCVTGPNLGQPIALLMLNVDATQRAAIETERSALAASLAGHMKEINSMLDPHERLECLVVVGEPWTVESGLITPTFKVRRNRVEDLYARNFEQWTARREAVIWYPG